MSSDDLFPEFLTRRPQPMPGEAPGADAAPAPAGAPMGGPKTLRRCAECGEFFSEKTLMYDLMITLQAEAPDVLDLDAAVQAGEDPLAAMERIIEEAQGLDVDELADQVHESYRFVVCPACRGRIHRSLKTKARLWGALDGGDEAR